MTGLTASLSLQAAFLGQTTQTGLDVPISGGNTYTTLSAFTYGTGADQATKAVQVVRALAGGANETLDLLAGTIGGDTLYDITGQAVTFTGLKLLAVEIIANLDESTAGSGLSVKPGASNPFPWLWGGGVIEIPQGTGHSGAKPTAGGVTVDGTHKTVLFTNLDATNKITYRLTLLGI